VVFDEGFPGGTSLNGRCSQSRGKALAESALLRVFPPHELKLDDRIGPFSLDDEPEKLERQTYLNKIVVAMKKRQAEAIEAEAARAAVAANFPQGIQSSPPIMKNPKTASSEGTPFMDPTALPMPSKLSFNPAYPQQQLAPPAVPGASSGVGVGLLRGPLGSDVPAGAWQVPPPTFAQGLMYAPQPQQSPPLPHMLAEAGHVAPSMMPPFGPPSAVAASDVEKWAIESATVERIERLSVSENMERGSESSAVAPEQISAFPSSQGEEAGAALMALLQAGGPATAVADGASVSGAGAKDEPTGNVKTESRDVQSANGSAKKSKGQVKRGKKQQMSSPVDGQAFFAALQQQQQGPTGRKASGPAVSSDHTETPSSVAPSQPPTASAEKKLDPDTEFFLGLQKGVVGPDAESGAKEETLQGASTRGGKSSRGGKRSSRGRGAKTKAEARPGGDRDASSGPSGGSKAVASSSTPTTASAGGSTKRGGGASRKRGGGQLWEG